MTEQTLYIDPDPHDWRSRKIHIRTNRRYASVVLDRDGYVDSTTSSRSEPELPPAYEAAVKEVLTSGLDRIWYEGHSGEFYMSLGSRWITLNVPFEHVSAAVEGLRLAELDHDYSGLHALAKQMALPLDAWLAPGERELIRGIDFTPSPRTFLRFLRGKAKGQGLHLNGRSTAGSVWVRPTLPPFQKQLRETFREQYPGWVDRWTGHIDPEDAPVRPWVGGRDQRLSYGAIPVEFRSFQTPSRIRCPCGMHLQSPQDRDDAHETHHAAWAFGVRSPKTLEWPGDLVVVTTQSPIAWRTLALQVARIPQRENRYDFPSWSHVGEPQATSDNMRAYLLQAGGRVIGYVSAHDTDYHRPWDLTDGGTYGPEDTKIRPQIILIWVADAYRRKGIGARLVQLLADEFGCHLSDVSWSTPVSTAGRKLARQISPSGIWVS